MIVIEHEAKHLLRQRGLPIPAGQLTNTSTQIPIITDTIGNNLVLKAQVPTGGRMKAGGVRFTSTSDEAAIESQNLLNMTISDFPVEFILVETRLNIQQEYFIAITYDDPTRQPIVIVSASGGIDIEDTSQSLITAPISPVQPFPDYAGRELATKLGLIGTDVVKFGAIVTALVHAFHDWDALLLECNPVVRDQNDQWWIADVHLELDDDARYRQTNLWANLLLSQAWIERRSPFEQQALEIDRMDHRGVAGRLVPFDGNLGLLIGGGGASLTIMDAILDAGLQPANYCEIGGNPSVRKIESLTRLILCQPQVDHLAVIMNVVSNTRVDLVARGVIKGILSENRDPAQTLIAFRIPGSWEDEGQSLLKHYGVPYFGRDSSIDDVVKAIKS
jgi:succinyl-CoA synthetase beta subunit/citryl-CoA synthetase large subunit